MDTLIEGLEMPKYRTLLEINPDGTVAEISPINNSRRRLDATAISIPNHGDLIDRDALANSIPEAEPHGFDNCAKCTCMTKDEMVEIIMDSEVVLEANK